jgi:hypothetical protein
MALDGPPLLHTPATKRPRPAARRSPRTRDRRRARTSPPQASERPERLCSSAPWVARRHALAKQQDHRPGRGSTGAPGRPHTSPSTGARARFRRVRAPEAATRNAPARDDEQARRVKLLLLGKGAVLVRRFDCPLAAEMDESEQSPGAKGANVVGCSFPTDADVRPVRRSRSLRTTNGSATWPHPLRPVHRHDVGAWELPIGGSSSTVAVATRQKEHSWRVVSRAWRTLSSRSVSPPPDAAGRPFQGLAMRSVVTVAAR